MLLLLQVIARAYGEHLTESGQHREAGISKKTCCTCAALVDPSPLAPPPVLAQCGCLQEALAAYEKASCWQQVFALSAQLKHSTADRVALARRVAGERRCFEALSSCEPSDLP